MNPTSSLRAGLDALVTKGSALRRQGSTSSPLLARLRHQHTPPVSRTLSTIPRTHLPSKAQRRHAPWPESLGKRSYTIQEPRAEAKKACSSCGTAIPVTTTPCSSCNTLLPLPTGLSHHSILGLSAPIPAAAAFSSPFDLPLELSQLPSHGYDLQPRDLRDRMLRLQRDLHPDRFAQSGEKAVELARELSGRVNEAYAVLSDPLKRADYLLSVHSLATEESDSLTDPILLAEILEAREDLESAESQDEVDKIQQDNHERVQTTIASLLDAFSQDPPNLQGAKDLAVQLRYWHGLEEATKDWAPGKRQVMIH